MARRRPVAVSAPELPARPRSAAPPRERWGDEAASPDWPFDDPSAQRFAILLDGIVRGMVQYGEEDEPRYRHASIDIFVDPAVDNVAAIRCYAAVGFRPVGLMRRYERDVDGEEWHDALLMDVLAGELDT